MQSSIAEVDLDKFYNCVEESVYQKLPKTLGLNYYEAEESLKEEWWSSDLGQEALVADSIEIPELHEYYDQLPHYARPIIPDQSIRQPSKGENSDIFETLPLETMAAIVENLPGTSLTEFAAATPAAARALASEFISKRRIKSDMPWLWDLPLDQALSCMKINWQQVYWDLDRRSTFQSSDAIPGLVNRRRIWKVCHQLAVMYAVHIHPVATHSGGIIEEIQTDSVCPYASLITDLATDTKSHHFRAIFLSDWLDLDTKHTYLQSHWNDEGLLTGLSVTMQGRPRRTFGLPSKKDVIRSLVLDPGDWIIGFAVSVHKGIAGLRVSDLFNGR